MNGEYGGNVPVRGADSQPQQTKADIRNILPLDLYEGMEYASLISSRLIFSRIGNNGELAIPPRDVKAFYRSFSKSAFVRALQKLIPEIQKEDLEPGGAGVRAQACDKQGGLLDDFYIIGDGRINHVCNAPSPAATASLSIGKYIAENILNT